MPELPEVETVRRSLSPLVSGHAIHDVRVFHPNMVRDLPVKSFIKILEGRTIIGIERRGKHLLFNLGDVWLLVHLRMEGKFLIKPADAAKEKHEHARFILDDGRALIYHDVRKFGTLRIRTSKTLHAEDPLASLGPEPLDGGFTAESIEGRLGTSRPIKAALLDQTTVSGIGNIYADEILFCARLHPSVPAHKVKRPTLKRIVRCAREVMKDAVEAGGTTIRTYRNALGIDGRFQLNLNVHTLEGVPCKVCKTPIRKTRVATRGTYYCPVCQKRR